MKQFVKIVILMISDAFPGFINESRFQSSWNLCGLSKRNYNAA